MSNIFKIILLASIGGLIGYITNVLAIKLLFRPIVPINIPVLNIKIWGLIPKRRSEIAKVIGEVVEQEFISIDEIMSEAIKPEDKQDIIDYIKLRVKIVINEKMTIIPLPFRGMIQGYVEEIIEDEVRESIDDLTEETKNKIKKRINIKQIVEDKINELDLLQIEEIILRVAKNELKHIEILGLVLGFLIGIIQGIIIIL